MPEWLQIYARFTRCNTISLSCAEQVCMAHLNILAHDVIKLLHYEYWTDKQKYFYVTQGVVWKIYFWWNSRKTSVKECIVTIVTSLQLCWKWTASQMFFHKLGQNLRNGYLNKFFLMYGKHKPVKYSPSGVLSPFKAGSNKRHT